MTAHIESIRIRNPPANIARMAGKSREPCRALNAWQAAGAAIYFTDAPWPDFDERELDAALALAR